MLVSITRRQAAGILVEKGLAKPASGIGHQKNPTGPAVVSMTAIEAIDPFDGREIGLNALNRPRRPCQSTHGRVVDFRLIGGDDQIVAFVRGDLGEFQADAARRAGDDGEAGGWRCRP